MTLRPKIIGLTGGIASGKSTVSKLFRELGAPLLDADVLAREVVQPGEPGLEAISRRFPGVVAADGTLDRRALGARIFAEPTERAALNALLHPLIHERFHAQVEALAARGATLVVYDAPLLIENQLHEHLDGVILVTLPRALQRERLMARDQLGEAEAEARLASQLPLEDKVPHATWLVDNSGTPEQTRVQVASIWKELEDMVATR